MAENLKMLVASHKPYWMPDDPAYLPVQVGAAGKETIPGFQRDDEGENISAKNPNYCELTALYWAWKNLDADYVGLAHYRRHFAGSGERGVMTGAEFGDTISDGVVLVPRRRRYFIESVHDQYIHAHHEAPLRIALQAMTVDGTYREAAKEVMSRDWLFLYNMFVMDANRFDRYMEWLFSILAEVGLHVDITDYSQYEARVFGFLGERLFNIWLLANDAVVCEKNIVSLESQNWPNKIARFLQRKAVGSLGFGGRAIE